MENGNKYLEELILKIWSSEEGAKTHYPTAPGLKTGTTTINRTIALISRQFELMINSGYNLGMSPIYWDRSSASAKITKSKLRQCFFYLTVFTICAGELCLIAAFSQSICLHGFQIKNVEFMQNFMIVLSTGCCIFLSFHTGLRRNELVGVTNGFLSFWTTFTRQYVTNVRNQQFHAAAVFISRVIKVSYYGLLSSCLATFPIYFGKCNFHVLAPILPVCLDYNSNPSEWWSQNPIFFILMGLVSFVWVWTQAVASFLVVTIVSMAVVFSHTAWKQLLADEDIRINLKLKSNKSWVTTYRQLQILSEYFNASYSNELWPILLFFLVILTSLTLSTSIRSNDVQFIRVGCLIVSITLIVMLNVFVEYGAKHYTHSQKFVSQKRCGAGDKYLRKVQYSCLNCTSFRIRVGGFGRINKFTFPALVSIIFEITLNILILAN